MWKIYVTFKGEEEELDRGESYRGNRKGEERGMMVKGELWY